MSIAEHIVKFIELLESSRIAAKLLVASTIAAVAAWMLRDLIRQVSGSLGIEPLPVYGLVAVAAYASAVLIVGAAIAGVEGIRKSRVRSRQTAASQRESENASANRASLIGHFLRHGSGEYMRILKTLLDAGQKELPVTGELHRLQSLGAIEDLVETKPHHRVYRLTQVAEPIVRQHFADERRRHIDESIKALTEAELQFLRLFTSAQSVYEDPDSSDLLPHAVYRGGESLVHKELAHRMSKGEPDYIEHWELAEDILPVLDRECALKPLRTRLALSLGRVQGSGSSGSGAGRSIL